jgi:hypothetical protein
MEAHSSYGTRGSRKSTRSTWTCPKMRMGCSETGQAAGSAEKAVEQRNARMILLIGLMRAFLPNVRGVG